LEGKGIVTTAG